MIIAPRIEANVITSNIAVVEAGIPVWDATATYNLKDKVQVNGTTNRIYEAVQAVPVGINPVDDVNPTTGVGTYWFDRGATNYMRAFDELSSSKTTNVDSIYYKFGISDVDVLLLEGLNNAATVRIVVTDNANGNVVKDTTYDVTTRDVYDWFDWTYEPSEYKRTFFALLPLVYDATLEIYIDNTGATVEVGHIAYGRSKKVGLSLISPSPVTSMRGVSTKRRDEFGNIITRRKARYRRMKISCVIDTKTLDRIEERLNDIADTPAIFVGDEREGGFRSLLVYGELRDHDMPISLVKSVYQLEVEGYL